MGKRERERERLKTIMNLISVLARILKYKSIDYR